MQSNPKAEPATASAARTTVTTAAKRYLMFPSNRRCERGRSYEAANRVEYPTMVEVMSNPAAGVLVHSRRDRSLEKITEVGVVARDQATRRGARLVAYRLVLAGEAGTQEGANFVTGAEHEPGFGAVVDQKGEDVDGGSENQKTYKTGTPKITTAAINAGIQNWRRVCCS